MQNIWHSFAIPIYCITNVKHMFYILYAMQMLYGSYAFVYHNLSLSKLPPRTKSSTQSKKHHWPPISLATAAGSLINSVKAAAPGTHGRVFAGCCCQRAYSKGTGESLNTYPYGTSEDNFHLPFFSYIRQKGTCGKN